MHVAYLGLGVIGRGMCGRLLGRVDALTVWNRTAAKAEPFVAQGASTASTPAEAVANADVICVCVADTPDVEQVVFGNNGAIHGAKAGTILLDFSTISAGATEAFAKRSLERGVRWIDAPVTGGDVGARNGTLTIMAGGDAADIDKVRPVLDAVGKATHHMGGIGAGQRTKMVNQIAVMGTIISMAESMNFAREKGMDVAKVLEVIGGGAAGSWSLNNYGPRVLRGDFDPGFSLKLLAKDLRIVLENLEGTEANYTALRSMAAACEKMVAEGKGHLGVHALVQALGWVG